MALVTGLQQRSLLVLSGNKMGVDNKNEIEINSPAGMMIAQESPKCKSGQNQKYKRNKQVPCSAS